MGAAKTHVTDSQESCETSEEPSSESVALTFKMSSLVAQPKVCLPTVQVHLTNKKKHTKATVNALLDECSTTSYLAERVAAQLKLEGPSCRQKITGALNMTTEVEGFASDLTLTSYDRKVSQSVRVKVFGEAVPDLQVTDWNTQKEHHPHLKHLSFAPVEVKKPVELLLGAEDVHLFRSLGVDIAGGEGAPIARLTPLGLIGIGATEVMDEITAAYLTRTEHVFRTSVLNRGEPL